jgi:hemerythrin-like domain-containing protein
MRIDSPVEHLMACHRRIEQRLDTLVISADHMGDDRGAAMAAIRRSFEFLDTSGVLHTEDEETSVFPRLRPKLSDAEIAFIDSLEAQHAEADTVYQEVKRLSGQLENVPDAVQRYRVYAERLRSLYRDHIRAEDENLMGLAARVLSESEAGEIAREMRERRRTG